MLLKLFLKIFWLLLFLLLEFFISIILGESCSLLLSISNGFILESFLILSILLSTFDNKLFITFSKSSTLLSSLFTFLCPKSKLSNNCSWLKFWLSSSSILKIYFKYILK